MKDVNNEKFRQIKTNNKVIASKVVPVDGALDLLMAVGFENDGSEILKANGDNLDLQAKRAVVLLDEAFTIPTAHLCTVLTHTQTVRGLYIDDDNKIIGSACLDNSVRIWEASTGSCQKELPQGTGHGRPARSDPGVLCIGMMTKDQELSVISGGRDGLVIHWKPMQEQVIRFLGHGEAVGNGPRPTNAQNVSCVCCASQYDLVITGGWDKTAISWDTIGDAPATRFGVFGAAVNGLCLAYDAAATLNVCGVAACGDGCLYFFEAAKKATMPGQLLPPYRTLDMAAGTVLRAIACSSYLQQDCSLVTASNDGVLRLWNTSQLVRGAALASPQFETPFLYTVAVAANRAAAAGDEGVVTVLQLPSLAVLQRIPMPGPVWSLALSSTFLVCGCEDQLGSFVFSYDPKYKAADFLIANHQAISGAAAQRAKHSVTILNGDAARPAAVRQAVGGGVSMGQGYDFQFPVDLGTGDGELQIQWNNGDDPTDVATRFCLTNRLPTGHVNEIVQFIQQASGQAPAQDSSGGTPIPTNIPAPSVQADMIAQITALGVDEARARDALDRAGWASVEAAVHLLF
uniref:UBA domain-containing protein n=1 Tax=Aureoumbra lagunensis TaxID=44058 RepID=A0A7S3NP67_9STRA